jgi:hypothetical protein
VNRKITKIPIEEDLAAEITRLGIARHPNTDVLTIKRRNSRTILCSYTDDIAKAHDPKGEYKYCSEEVFLLTIKHLSDFKKRQIYVSSILLRESTLEALFFGFKKIKELRRKDKLQEEIDEQENDNLRSETEQ